MAYIPKIKNLPYLLKDLRNLLSGHDDAQKVYLKIKNLDYEFDTTDGFEDLLDVIRPFIKNFKYSSDEKRRLNIIIDMLDAEAPIQEIEKYCSFENKGNEVN